MKKIKPLKGDTQNKVLYYEFTPEDLDLVEIIITKKEQTNNNNINFDEETVQDEAIKEKNMQDKEEDQKIEISENKKEKNAQILKKRVYIYTPMEGVSSKEHDNFLT